VRIGGGIFIGVKCVFHLFIVDSPRRKRMVRLVPKSELSSTNRPHGFRSVRKPYV
jgi:hypothetical protein